MPQETILRHKELLEMNEISHTLNGINDESGATVATAAANDLEETSKNLRQDNVLSKNTNTTTATANATATSTPSPNNGNITTTTVANKTLNGLTTEAQLSLNEKVNNLLNLQQQQHPHNNHPSTQRQTKNILDNCRNIVDNFNNDDKNSSSSPLPISIENCDDDDEQDEESSDKMLDNAAIIRRTDVDDRTLTRRKRLISTSLTKTPIVDGAFEDFHQHKLKNAEDPFDPKYKLYAVVVSRIYNIFFP